MAVQLFATSLFFPDTHDWTIKTDGWEFGITETDYGDFATRYPTVFKPTTVYLGKTSFATSFAAYECLAIIGVIAMLLVATVSLVIARTGRSPKAGTQAPC